MNSPSASLPRNAVGSIKAAAVGGLLGLLVLHPFSMVVHFFQFTPTATVDLGALASGLAASAGPAMILMTVAYTGLGALAGVLYARYGAAVRSSRALRESQRKAIARNLPRLIEGGENGELEFKSSLRWDRKLDGLNKGLEASVVKTMAGFMNADGGILLLGIADSGEVTGLEADYATLRQQDADGLHQHLMHLVASRLGADLCLWVDVVIEPMNGHDIGIVSVLPSHRPAYVERGTVRDYFVRTGNSTRALNTEEAVAHIRHRFPS